MTTAGPPSNLLRCLVFSLSVVERMNECLVELHNGLDTGWPCGGAPQNLKTAARLEQKVLGKLGSPDHHRAI